MTIETTGIFGLIIFILNVYAIIKTITSSISGGHKVMWILLLLLLPLLGLILWFFLGPKAK
ncbi:MAG: PLDc N-terminal domain-containing protein [Pseudomonadota bacterium]